MAKDKIILDGMTFYGYHGVSPEEKKLGQRLVVDLEITADLRKAGRSDSLPDTIDYGDIYRLVKGVMEGPSHSLLESLGEEIALEVLKHHLAEEVKVRIKKPGVPIKGSILAWAAVEITRSRESP